MNPADIPKVKRLIRSARLADAKRMLEEAMAFSSHDEIERYVLDHMRTHFAQLIGETSDAASGRPV
jgi:signal transduction protein with GAF and PtsI domain